MFYLYQEEIAQVVFTFDKKAVHSLKAFEIVFHVPKILVT